MFRVRLHAIAATVTELRIRLGQGEPDIADGVDIIELPDTAICCVAFHRRS